MSDASRNPVALAVAALVVASAAVGLAVWALLRPSPTEPSYTDAQRAEAKATVCTAYQTVRNGVSTNTNLQAPGGEGDVTGSLAVAANARVALYDGGQYLLARLDPAAPPELADAVRKVANGLMDIGAAATAGAQNTDPNQAARLKDAAARDSEIESICR